MSVNFDPKHTSNEAAQPSLKPKLSLFHIWCNMVLEGQIKESWPSLKYCERAWVQKTGSSPELATKVFMDTCIEECESYKRLCNWFRMN